MRECNLEKTSITYRWVLETALPSLPGPGTPAFVTLWRGLRPYGISTTGVTIESPTPRLDDVVLNIWLPDDQIAVRLYFGRIELFCSDMHKRQQDASSFNKILEVLFSALRSLGVDDYKGNAQFNWQSHLSLSPLEVDLFLQEHLHTEGKATGFLPDGFGYNIRWADVAEIQGARVAVMKSLMYPDSLYIDLFIEYTASTEPTQSTAWFIRDAQRVLMELSLNVRPYSKEVK